MSYARMGTDSDVYVYLSVYGSFQCCGCRLTDDYRSHTFDTTDGIIAHLRAHLACGHAVPERTIPRLERERDENDAYIAEVRDAPREEERNA